MADTIPTRGGPPRMFAIQRKSDGKWSRGGCGPSWGSFPKTWGSGPFKNHLNMFKTSAYHFKVTEAKEWLAGTYKYTWYSYALPAKFTRYKLLNDRFPYFDCEVCIFDETTLQIVDRIPAEEFAWDVYKSSYLKNDARYVPAIKEFASEFGLEFD